jgi:hypothetical protein
VKYDIDTGKLTTVFNGVDKLDLPRELRGGSHLVTVGNYYLCITHEVQFTPDEQGRKDGIYTHRFISYDKNWNIVGCSNEFNLMGAKIEFVTGMAIHKNDLLITFGFQDNASFLIRLPINKFKWL